MIKIGLTGSIASGKSEAVKIFHQAGIPVFDADAEVHKLYNSPHGVALLRPLAATAISNNKVDRNLLSGLIRKDPALLDQVERVVHKEISRMRTRFLADCAARGEAFVVLDIPLLFETGADKTVDKTITVDASAIIRRERALARPGMTEEKLNMMLARQMPDHEKRRRADIVLENNGTLTEFQAKVRDAISELRKGNVTDP